LRPNGTTVYMTQDLGTAMSRIEHFHPEKMIYVVATEQDRHFIVLFKILETLEPALKGRFYHLSYGMVNLPTGRMKSREGTVVDADELLNTLEKEAQKATREKWPDITEDDVQHRARYIALSAVKFYILKFVPKSTVLFDPKKSIDFKGNTGPYLLYTYARTRSILSMAGFTDSELPFDKNVIGRLWTEEERHVCLGLCALPAEIKNAAQSYDPSKIADSIFQIAKRFNLMYKDKHRNQIVKCEDPVLKTARLLLVRAVGNSLKLGLSLLGIETLERM